MEEKKKLKITANKKIITFSLIALALLMLVSTSYAYFTAVIEGNDTAKKTTVTSATMSLRLHGNTQVGMSSAMPGDSTTITFSVENTGTLATTYALNLDQVTNNFVDKSDLVYIITSTNNGGSKTETVIPSANGILIPVVSIEPNVTQEYTMTITFKETNDIQNDNQGKTFTGRVQIEEVNGNMLATRVLADNTLIVSTPDFSIGEPPVSGINTGSGLYATEDDEGISYYFRGNIANNYVLFANNLWRIVRVNGSGSTRLVKEDDIGQSAYNIIGNDHKYVGYTYDNDHICTKSNPCINATGTASTIKIYLDDWYDNNLKDFNSYIELESYCNDTVGDLDNNNIYNYVGNGIFYGEQPSLKCEDTGNHYGGLYKLKIGLLTLSEIKYAGLYYNIDYEGNTNLNYLSKNIAGWTMTPIESSTFDPNLLTTYHDGILDMDGEDFNDISVYPVINLKSDVLVTSGNGTKDNPYVIE